MRLPEGIVQSTDGFRRCWWCVGDPLYLPYHDGEWGFPVADDRRLFEKLSLEGFQTGLSWLTILRKRDHFRRVFRGFDIEAVARLTSRDVEQLMNDPGIVRNRRKIEATISNARRALELIEEHGSVAAFVWQYEPSPRSRPAQLTKRALLKLSTTAESAALSKELKRRGWAQVGSTTAYAFMQAVGIVNDHVEGCDVRGKVESARSAFVRPRGRASENRAAP